MAEQVKGNVCFLIRSLEAGGAQRQLTLLAKGLHRKGVPVKVITFYPDGSYGRELKMAGVPVTDLKKRARSDVLLFLFHLMRTLRRERPTALYCFLSVANILGVLMRPLVPGMRLIWGIRASNLEVEHEDRVFRCVGRLEAGLSRFTDVIVCNSHSGREHHAGIGFPGDKMVVIENGIDVETLQFNASERALVRQEWRVADGEQLIGLVARLDPMKDHPTFLAASALLSRRDSMVRFVCVGDGPPVYRSKLFAQAQSLGLGDRVMWAGLRDDMPAVYSALDIAVSSSSGEGFCNAVAEAMACGVPCVVTQVGESPDIVGDVGRVVPAGNAEALAAALLEMLGLPVEERLLMGQAARRRIASLYSLDRMVERTADLLDVE